MKPIELSICVLHYNRWDLTKDCLASIDAQEIPCSYEKVLVDNGSEPPFKPEVLPQGWRLVRLTPNRGHIAGQNKCFEYANGEWVLFVANDVRLHQYCLQQLWEARDEGVLLQPTLLTVSGKVDNRGLCWDWPGYGLSVRRGNDPDAITSTCYLIHKRAWHSIGRLDESLQTSHEDIEFCLRGRILGYVAESLPYTNATHLGNATLRHQPSHNRAAFHRDRLYVLRKHYRGLDYWTRYLTIQVLDHLPRLG